MSSKPVTLSVKSHVALPKRITLPMVIVAKLNLARELIINRRQQQVPEAVANWLLSQRRYAGWFDVEKPSPAIEPKPKNPPKAPTKQTAKNPPS